MTTEPVHGQITPSSARADRSGRRLLYIVAAAIIGGFGIGAAAQTTAFYSAAGGTVDAHAIVHQFLPRLAVNFVTGAIALLLMAAAGLVRRTGWALVGLTAAIAVISASILVVLQWLLSLELEPGSGPALLEFGFGVLVVALGASVGSMLVQTTTRLRMEEMRSATQSLTAAAALTALQSEELRVRRDVAEGLHGTVQQRLVLAVARIDEISRLIDRNTTREESVRLLGSLRADIDDIRLHDVREMSQMLYPDGLEVGLTQAIRIMMRRVPSTIAVDLRIDQAVGEVDGYDRGLDEMRRLNLMRILEEGVSNALKHGRAARLRVDVSVVGERLCIAVEDDGSGLAPEPKLHGLSLLEQRLNAFGGSLRLEPGKALGGALLSAELPVDVSVLDAPSPHEAVRPALFDETSP